MGPVLRAGLMLVIAACATPTPPPVPPTLTITAQMRGGHQGEVVILTVQSDAPLTAVRARAFDRTIPAVPSGADWRVLVGIDLSTPLGTHQVQVDAESPTGPATASWDLVITAKAFPTRRLTVNPDFVNPPAAVTTRIAEEATRLNALWAAAPTTPLEPLLQFIPPVPHPANSAFGTRSIFNGESRGSHGGADFLSPTGTPIKAPAPGTVVLAEDLYYTGGTVIIDHGLGLYSLFAHLSAITSAPGDVVARGTTVGRVGATGRVTGAHLHWTVRLNGARVDPLALLTLLPAGPSSQLQ